jgi:hypothetical protein
MENLFSYGTLQRESVQFATFGRRLDGRTDVLDGYAIALVPIKDQEAVRGGETHYRNIQFTGNEADVVEGTAFSVTSSELEQADVYEASAEYKRVTIGLRSGVSSWVYLHMPE